MPPKRRAASDVEGLPNSAPKRARFADPHDDDRASSNAAKVKKKEATGTNENFDSAGFADEVDATLDMAGKQKRKGAVKVDGYESDSTDDGEGVVLSRRKAEQEEDNDDMFAMGDGDDDEEKKDDGKKKQTRYLQLGEIEGQEFGADDEEKEFDEDELGVDEDSVSSSEPEDEDDAERRKKAGMGYELTKFNMKEEMEEGKFAEDGMYVRSYDAHATHDRWLEDVAERDIKKARRAKRKAEKREQERVKEEKKSIEEITADGARATGKAGMEKKLLEYLLPSETVLEALARLGREKKKKEAKLKKKAKAEDTSMHGSTKEESKPVVPQVSDIDRITTLASALMAEDPEIYSNTYEGILRSVRRSGIVPQDWKPPVAMYEYRWATTDGGKQHEQTVYGPFEAQELDQWYKATFFGIAGEKIRLRKVGNEEWEEWDDIFL